MIKEINKIFIFVIAILIFVILPIRQSQAWGPLTHMAINHDAYEKVYISSEGDNYKIFIVAWKVPQNSDTFSTSLIKI